MGKGKGGNLSAFKRMLCIDYLLRNSKPTIQELIKFITDNTPGNVEPSKRSVQLDIENMRSGALGIRLDIVAVNTGNSVFRYRYTASSLTLGDAIKSWQPKN